ncbi:hypothetical protein [Candidatus Nitrotoga sp. HW29]|uniref:hypothetical protein n=1 Tax=Candidatus Nitrotoga sp. HW29 TaxID=2886963 RepID=UPI001EF32C97|nr:hypothetical protein [Candidatus Nitrotoga sp. HW29]
MKRFLFVAALVIITAPALAANVGVSVNIGQPGFYGRIDIGNYPQPQLIYSAPVMVQPVPMGTAPQPIYLRVPPGHRKNWRKHCQRYGACGQSVYFVRDNWYNNVYVPSYRTHGNYQGEERGGYGGGRGSPGRGHDRD